jgi:hypothetical protein
VTDTASSQSAKPEFRRCRSLTVLGKACNQRAQRGSELCVAHARNRFPVCPQGDKIAIPLLEDLPTIRVVATQVAHGLFTQVLDPWRAGKILYACQVAAMTLPRPERAALTNAQRGQEQSVTETFSGPDGQILGPAGRWEGLGATYEPVWRYDKYLYAEECYRLKKPEPQSPADMPPEGWLTPREADDPELNYHLSGSMHSDITPFRDAQLQLRIEADRDGKLPPLEERACAYAYNRFCKGPGVLNCSVIMCHYCALERDEHLRLPPREEPSAPADPPAPVDLQAAAVPQPMLSTQYSHPTPAPATQTCCRSVGGGGPNTTAAHSSGSPRVDALERKQPQILRLRAGEMVHRERLRGAALRRTNPKQVPGNRFQVTSLRPVAGAQPVP